MILIYTLIICIFSILLENVAVDPIVRPAPSQQNGAGLSSFTMSMLAQQQQEDETRLLNGSMGGSTIGSRKK